MNKLLLTLILWGTGIILFAQELPGNFYKRFEGAINGKYKITVNLVKVDSVLTGSYYYNDKGELINFIRSSIDSAGNIYLEEDAGYNDEYNPVTTGIFKGKYHAGTISGTWEKPNSDKSFSFSVEEKYPPGSAPLDIHHYSKTYSEFGRASAEVTSFSIKDFPDKSVREKINTYFSKNLPSFGLRDSSQQYGSVEELINDFIDMYIIEIVEDSANFPDYKPEYDYSAVSEVLYNSDYLLSLENINYTFLGGAHPNTFIGFLNFNLSTGDILKAEDIFKPGYEQRLNALGEKKFREYYSLTEDESLEEAGFWFENGFSLNNNFSITKGGIQFLFNQYEVGPYVLGAPQVYFSFDEIKDLVKEESIIAMIR